MKGAQIRLLKQQGAWVTLRNYTRSEADGRESWDETAESPHSIKALKDPVRQPQTDHDAYDAGDVDAVRSYHVESGTTAELNARDGGGDGATEIDDNGQEWVVLQIDRRDTGLTELICERDA